MKKVNKELNLLKQYENVFDDVDNLNAEEIKELTGNSSHVKEYETFFMTTKNTNF